MTNEMKPTARIVTSRSEIKKLKFCIVFPEGDAVSEKTKFTFSEGEKFVEKPEHIKGIILRAWRKSNNVKTFQQWADELNEDPNYEGAGTFTADDARDNLASTMFLNISGKHVDLYKFIKEVKSEPLTKLLKK